MNIRVIEEDPEVKIEGSEDAEHNSNNDLFLDGSDSFNKNY